MYKLISENNNAWTVIDQDGGFTEFTGNEALREALDFIDETEANS